MKKNECAQEMILDLITRHGCEVKLYPHADKYRNAIEIVISHKGYHSGIVVDLNLPSYPSIPWEEIACREIARAAEKLFGYPYEQMMKKHFRRED